MPRKDRTNTDPESGAKPNADTTPETVPAYVLPTPTARRFVEALNATGLSSPGPEHLSRLADDLPVFVQDTIAWIASVTETVEAVRTLQPDRLEPYAHDLIDLITRVAPLDRESAGDFVHALCSSTVLAQILADVHAGELAPVARAAAPVTADHCVPAPDADPTDVPEETSGGEEPDADPDAGVGQEIWDLDASEPEQSVNADDFDALDPAGAGA